MIRLRPSGITGINTITNHNRVSYDSRTDTFPHDLQAAVRVDGFFLP